MERRPSTQDLTWLLDLNENSQLDLNPPYQRRSVWTRRDKQFFLDTIFRNYPSPAIFLHKTIDEAGKATYHVVDGKQRTQTILQFVSDKLRVANGYGDSRLDGKKWSELKGETSLRKAFWNYQITVEMIDIADGSIVNEVFDRLNRNSRKLTAQELRHAKFDGWLISTAEAESKLDEWRSLGVVTTARARRMADTQFLSELMLVVLERDIMGFDQDVLDDYYVKYDEPAETVVDFAEDEFMQRFAEAKQLLLSMEKHHVVTTHARSVGHFYTLWAVIALCVTKLPSAKRLADHYGEFMNRVTKLAEQENLEEFLRAQPDGAYANELSYLTNSRGASTDLRQRQARLDALRSALLR